MKKQIIKHISIWGHQNNRRDLLNCVQSVKVKRANTLKLKSYDTFIVTIKTHDVDLWKTATPNRLRNHLLRVIGVNVIISLEGGDVWRTK